MDKNISIQYFNTPFGELILGSYQNQLVLCDWRYRKMRESIDRRIQTTLNATYKEENNELIRSAQKQMEQYFVQRRKSFELDYRLIGTKFQQKVWQALANIPYGETETYLGLSKSMGNADAIRAVATANGANALSIIIPCHRIIGSDGKLIGYAGGLNAKKKLLRLEGAKQFANQMELF